MTNVFGKLLAGLLLMVGFTWDAPAAPVTHVDDPGILRDVDVAADLD